MHPSSIKHVNTFYDLSHIPRSHASQFSWTGQNGQKLDFKVEVTYSRHCYSEQLKLGDAVPSGSYTFTDKGEKRIFCPLRHAHSLILPDLIGGLFNKPASQIMKPKEKPNWLFYQMEMVPPLQSGQRYYVFFNLRQRPSDRDSIEPCWLSMFIESAYARNQRVGTTKRQPFGRLAEEIVSSNRVA
jgi:hypothetical protein